MASALTLQKPFLQWRLAMLSSSLSRRQFWLRTRASGQLHLLVQLVALGVAEMSRVVLAVRAATALRGRRGLTVVTVLPLASRQRVMPWQNTLCGGKVELGET